MLVEIVNQTQIRIPRKFLVEWVEAVATELKRKRVIKNTDLKKSLTLVFLDKTPARKLNKQFRGKDYATDVLSFESLEPSELGELVMCPEVLRNQAREHGLSFKEELAYMVLHGILHLLGFDHEKSEQEAKVMFHLQDQIFEKLI